jgi:hypothetical protein
VSKINEKVGTASGEIVDTSPKLNGKKIQLTVEQDNTRYTYTFSDTVPAISHLLNVYAVDHPMELQGKTITSSVIENNGDNIQSFVLPSNVSVLGKASYRLQNILNVPAKICNSVTKIVKTGLLYIGSAILDLLKVPVMISMMCISILAIITTITLASLIQYYGSPAYSYLAIPENLLIGIGLLVTVTLLVQIGLQKVHRPIDFTQIDEN